MQRCNHRGDGCKHGHTLRGLAWRSSGRLAVWPPWSVLWRLFSSFPPPHCTSFFLVLSTFRVYKRVKRINIGLDVTKVIIETSRGGSLASAICPLKAFFFTPPHCTSFLVFSTFRVYSESKTDQQLNYHRERWTEMNSNCLAVIRPFKAFFSFPLHTAHPSYSCLLSECIGRVERSNSWTLKNVTTGASDTGYFD